jgi:hypothetical protein
MILLSRHGAIILVLVVFATILGFQIDHGLASGDGHGIVRTVQTLLSSGKIDVSRPPGHPTTELYLFGAAGWILFSAFGIEFGDQIYLVCQALAALATLIVFYELLLRIGATRVRAVLATICLACSAQFLFNALDGEEFNFGILFLLISFRLLIPAPASVVRLSLSIFSFALATGCRPELVFAAIIFPIYCLLDVRLGWKYVAVAIFLCALSTLIVWSPILMTQVRAPYPSGMNLWASLFGAGYKLAFQSFGLPVFLLLIWILAASLMEVKPAFGRSFPENFVFIVSCLVPLIFFAVFFYYATKAAFVLVALPFLLLLAVQRSVILVSALTAATVASLFVAIDVFKDRQLTRPFLIPGSYFQAVEQKPYYKLDYLRKLSAQCENRPAVIIGNAWPWDFEYHIERNNFAAREQDLHGEIKRDLPTFFANGEHCVFMSPEAAYETALLKEWQQKGYAMKMDATFYRTLFARYDVHSALTTTTADVSGVPFALFHAN